MLYLIELYPSIQGETSLAGHLTTFIRLAGCNLRCSWCDTPHSFGRGQAIPVATILEEVEKHHHRHVCITGGEPLLQENVYPLMTQLCDRGYIVSLETGGGLCTRKVDPRVHVILDIKCPGSGMHQKNVWGNIARLRPHDEVKYVLLDRHDYDYAKQTCTEHSLYAKVNAVLFSPVFGKLDPKELVGWMLADKLPVRLNVQIHKYVWSPHTLGV